VAVPPLAAATERARPWREGGKDWERKHHDFWFAQDRVITLRVPPDDDDEPATDEASSSSPAVSPAASPAVSPASSLAASPDASPAASPTGSRASTPPSSPHLPPPLHVSLAAMAPKRNVVSELFEITTTSAVTCDDCLVETRTVEKHTCLSLPLAASATTSATTSAAPVASTQNKKKKGGKRDDTVEATAASKAPTAQDDADSLERCLVRFSAPERLLVANGVGFRCITCAKKAGLPLDRG